MELLDQSEERTLSSSFDVREAVDETDASHYGVVVVLTGPPGAGKTTVARLFEDCGFSRHALSAIEEDLASDSASITPRSEFVIDGVHDQKVVPLVQSVATAPLVVRVDAPFKDRLQRCVDNRCAGGVVSTASMQTVLDRLEATEDAVEPYPQHDICIENSNDVSTTELLRRVTRLVDAIKQ